MHRECLIANSNLVPAYANWETFHELDKKGLMMYGQMTAGSWIYIGSQGIVQGTYETFAELAKQHFGESLKGTITLTAGLGGMGAAQPLAVTMAGGVCIGIEVDETRIDRRIETRYTDVKTDSLDEAIRLAEEAKARRESVVNRTYWKCSRYFTRNDCTWIYSRCADGPNIGA